VDLLRKIFCLVWLAWGCQRVGMTSTALIDMLELAGDSDGPEAFDCQLKLVTGWWRRWSPEERTQFLQTLAVSWPEVGEQLRGREML
jgi:hypothetical protein